MTTSLKNVVIIAEYFEDFADRYLAIVDELRRRHPEAKCCGILFSGHVPREMPAGSAPFDNLKLIRRPWAVLRGSGGNADTVVCLVGHTHSFGNFGVYFAGMLFPARHKLYAFRNVISLQKAYDDEVASRKLVFKKILNGLRWVSEIQIKSHLLVLLVWIAYPFLRAFRPRRRGPQPYKILAIKLDLLGDMVVNMPYLFALKRMKPDVHLTILASARGAAILQEQLKLDSGLYDRLIVWDTPWHFKRKLLGVTDLLALVKKIPSFVAEGYDLVFQPVPIGVGVLLAGLTCGRRTVAIIDPQLPLSRLLRPFVSEPVEIIPKRIYHIEDFSRILLGKLGVTLPSEPRFLVAPADLADVAAMVGMRRGWVIFNIGAGDKLREWGGPKFGELARRIISTGEMVVLVGSKGDLDTAREIEELAAGDGLVNMVGRWSLNQLAAAISLSDLVVTADTGIMHLAAAVNARIVAIFGAGHVPFCHPLTSDYVVVKHELGCSGCADNCFTTGRPPCLESVGVEEVYDKVFEYLKQRDEKQ